MFAQTQMEPTSKIPRLVVALKGADIHVDLACAYRTDGITCRDVSVQQVAKILILAMSRIPKQLEIVKCFSAACDGAPYPMRTRAQALDVNFLHIAVLIGKYRVKDGRVRYRKQQQAKIGRRLEQRERRP